MKFGALAFIVFGRQKYAIQLQLLGGVWILQTLPAIVIGLYTRRLHRWGLLAGWAIGMATGTWMALVLEFKGTVYPLRIGGVAVAGYAGLWALVANLAVAVTSSALLDALRVESGKDATREEDYGGA